MKKFIPGFIVGLVTGIVAGWLIWSNVIGGLMTNKKCPDGMSPDVNGCCSGEEYTDMGEKGFNCCPTQGDCFPPIK